MTYQVVGEAARNPNFQNRCRGSVISLGAAILAAATDSNAIQNNAGQDLTTTACKNMILNYLKGEVSFSDEVVANLMLLNSDVATNPLGSTEFAIEWQSKEIILRLVEIG